jgi:hypothetical protein
MALLFNFPPLAGTWFWQWHCDSIWLYHRAKWCRKLEANTESNYIFETNCTTTEMSPMFTHLAPTSSPCTSYKAGLPTNENQLRYSRKNITMQSSHCNSLAIINHKVEVPHLRNISLGKVSPHLKITVNFVAFIYFLFLNCSYLYYILTHLTPHTA